jgi:hypothetical protein
MKARVQRQAELQAHRFLPASTSRAAININSTARRSPHYPRCTHNSAHIKAARFIHLTLYLAPAAPEKKEVKNGLFVPLSRALDKRCYSGGGEATLRAGSPTTDFAALWD